MAEWAGAACTTGDWNMEGLDVFPFGRVFSMRAEFIGSSEDSPGLAGVDASRKPNTHAEATGRCLRELRKGGSGRQLKRGAVAMASMPAHGLGRAGACPHGLPAGGARVDATGTATSSSFTHGSWSVSGTGDGRDWQRLASVGPAGSLGPPSSTASPVGSYAPPGSTTSSSFPTNPGGPSSSSRPTIKGRGKGLHEYATVVMAPHRPANRLNDGPTMFIREGESEREALLRILQAPLPPNLHPDRPAETPSQRRSRYLQDARSTVVGLLARCDS